MGEQMHVSRPESMTTARKAMLEPWGKVDHESCVGGGGDGRVRGTRWWKKGLMMVVDVEC